MGSGTSTSAAPLETAGASQLSFVGNRKAAAQAEATAAGCLIVPLDHRQHRRPHRDPRRSSRARHSPAP